MQICRAQQPCRRVAGFTLIELLVVIGIIAVLVGILLPTLSKARAYSQLINCQSNLRQVAVATAHYALDHRDFFPGASTTGGWQYRMAPGRKTVGDPAALPEVYGLAAVLHGIRPNDDLSNGLPMKGRYLPGDSKVWVCPSATEQMQSYGNTYAFSINSSLEVSRRADGSIVQPIKYTRVKKTGDHTALENFLWMFENIASLPGLTGFRGPFVGYNMAARFQVYPHKSSNKEASNYLYLDGHIEVHLN